MVAMVESMRVPCSTCCRVLIDDGLCFLQLDRDFKQTNKPNKGVKYSLRTRGGTGVPGKSHTDESFPPDGSAVHHQTEQRLTQTRYIAQEKLSCRASKPKVDHKSSRRFSHNRLSTSRTFLSSSVLPAPMAQRKLKSIVLKAEGMGISMAEIFGVFDKDGSGVITASELAEGLGSLGVFEEDISREQVGTIARNHCYRGDPG